MAQKIRLWEVTGENTVSEIPGDSIPLEGHLEDWLASNIAVLDPDLLVIGRQVPTAHGGTIDLLCIDAEGVLVVVELKRGKTPREVAAQALDYASWVKDADIGDIADSYLGGEGALKKALEAKFDRDLPEVFDEHRSLIVAESVDDSTERIVRYLADWGVPINVATVQHFKDASGRQMLAQVYLVEAEIGPAKPRVNRRQQRQALADELGIGGLFAGVRSGVRGVLYVSGGTSKRSVWYAARTSDGGQRTVLIVFLRRDDGGMPFLVHVDRIAEHLGIGRESIEAALPDDVEEDQGVQRWSRASAQERQGAVGLSGTFRTVEEVAKFTDTLQAARNRP